ncbi:MAG: pentapeptide repeat-containing protein [Gillisia sp.]
MNRIDLQNSIFEKCKLSGVIFENSILENSHFKPAQSFSIDPELNRIRNAKFSATNISGLLDRYNLIIESF